MSTMKNRFFTKNTQYLYVFICSFLFITPLFSSDRGMGTGFYGGIAVGYAGMSGNRVDSGSIPSIPVSGTFSGSGDLSGNSMQGQIFAGYMQKLWDLPFAVATEFYLGFDNLSQTRSGVLSGVVGGFPVEVPVEGTFKRNFAFGIPVKLGFLPNESWFFYALLGLDASLFEYTAEENGSGTGIHAQGKRLLYGVAYGGGIDYKLPNAPMIVGIEIKNTNYNRSSISLDNSGGTFFEFNQDTNIFNALLRVAYLF